MPEKFFNRNKEATNAQITKNASFNSGFTWGFWRKSNLFPDLPGFSFVNYRTI